MYFIIGYGGSVEYHCMRGGGAARPVEGDQIVISLRCSNYISHPSHLDCHWRGRCVVKGESMDGLSRRLTELPIEQCTILEGRSQTSRHSRHSQLCTRLQYLRVCRNISPGVGWDRCVGSIRRAQEQIVRDHALAPVTGRVDPDLVGYMDHQPPSPTEVIKTEASD